MRIDPKPLHDHGWPARLVFWKQRRRYGKPLAPALLWGRSPWLLVTLALLYGAIERRRSPVAPALRALITVRVSQINRCGFCVDINSSILLRRGISTAKVEALARWHESSLFDERERAALAYADAVTRTDGQVTEALFDRLRAHFDDEAIIELTALIAFQNLSSKFNAALDVPVQGFCPLPDPSSGARATAQDPAEDSPLSVRAK